MTMMYLHKVINDVNLLAHSTFVTNTHTHDMIYYILLTRVSPYTHKVSMRYRSSYSGSSNGTIL